ncbi:MAG: adenylate/guanylate cyclase domain-containing protein [Methylococcales bacterium]|nr:adenylate/guanylate cyclase domain-containing protein [Methylococcales bacterium]MDD5754292.1 adenylate/guanylate cyclase domain-containing protein [Methylococcales bacterium]
MLRHNKKKPKKYTLKFTLVAAFCGLSLLGSLILTVVTSYEMNGFIREQLRLRITDVARIMASQIDGNLHSEVKTVADTNTASFIKLKNNLQAMRHYGTGITNTYTLRKMDNGDIMLVIDASKKNQNVTGDIYPPNLVSKTLLSAFGATPDTENKIMYTEPDIYKTDWGVWLSAYAPIFTSAGKLDGIVGVDVSAQNISDHEQKYKITMILVSLTITSSMLLLGFFMASKIRRPLAELTIEMEKVGKFELDSEMEIKSKISEINSMAYQLESMKHGLRSFKKYVPDDLVRELIELGTDANLGGEKKNLTIFFSDITNFTAISERLEPEKLVGFLGEYLTVMNASLLKNKATVDKYIGDSVMAFWGAPRNVENPAIKSCHAALECQRQIRLLSQKWKSEHLNFDFHTRIGIHTGEVIVGNIGSETRMNYTVIGDNVNLASRIESANKFYGTAILISETTYQEAKNNFVTRLVDYAVLVGKVTPIQLHELVGCKGYVGEKKVRQIEIYEKAFNFYQLKQFSAAIVLLEKLVKQVPADCPTQLLLKRCQDYKINPPPDDWQGEYVLVNK